MEPWQRVTEVVLAQSESHQHITVPSGGTIEPWQRREVVPNGEPWQRVTTIAGNGDVWQRRQL